MHEASLVSALLRQVESLMRAHRAGKVTLVRVTVGEFSGVEPDLLQVAFERQVDLTPLAGARLELTCIRLEATCRQCRQVFAVQQFHFACPECHSSDLEITGGEELLLDSVTMEAEP